MGSVWIKSADLKNKFFVLEFCSFPCFHERPQKLHTTYNSSIRWDKGLTLRNVSFRILNLLNEYPLSLILRSLAGKTGNQ